MVKYPAVQRKAQAELDRVVGRERMPTFADRDSLPFIHAIALECVRWNTVLPIGVPHRVTEDDEYEGYHVPKGSIIIPNVW